jgi:hypothetical protein
LTIALASGEIISAMASFEQPPPTTALLWERSFQGWLAGRMRARARERQAAREATRSSSGDSAPDARAPRLRPAA